ncbi:MAG: hypothetical protein GX811_05115 [Lentisphaerae bacterium]|nr:hypothetical protein [Lentisphaerota bacterium]
MKQAYNYPARQVLFGVIMRLKLLKVKVTFCALIFAIASTGFSQVIELANDYIKDLNTDTNGTIFVARNFESYLDGPLTGSGTLTLKGGFVTTSSSMLTLINAEGNTFSGDIVVDVDGGIFRLASNLFVTDEDAKKGFRLPGMNTANKIKVFRGGRFHIQDNLIASLDGFLSNRLGTEGQRPSLELAGGLFWLIGPAVSTVSTQTVGHLTLAVGGLSTVTVTRNRSTATPKLCFRGCLRRSVQLLILRGQALVTLQRRVARLFLKHHRI